MIAKIAVFLAVVAVAYGGVAGVVSLGGAPASTVRLASPVAYAAAPHVAYAAGPRPIAYAAAPAPIAYTAAVAPAPVAIPGPVAYATAPRVHTIVEPVEQHGYKIAY